MSTRAIIARQTDGGWEGVYSHSDGYPTGLGRTLVNACREHFAGDAGAMARFMIDEHPTGWSSIGTGNPALAVGYSDVRPDYDDEEAYRAFYAAPRCYCHSERADHRAESTALRTQVDAPNLWDIEWLYVLAPDALLVFAGCGDMRPVGRVSWDDVPTDEDWKRIECSESLERCPHVAGWHS